MVDSSCCLDLWRSECSAEGVNDESHVIGGAILVSISSYALLYEFKGLEDGPLNSACRLLLFRPEKCVCEKASALVAVVGT